MKIYFNLVNIKHMEEDLFRLQVLSEIRLNQCMALVTDPSQFLQMNENDRKKFLQQRIKHFNYTMKNIVIINKWMSLTESIILRKGIRKQISIKTAVVKQEVNFKIFQCEALFNFFMFSPLI